MKKIYHKLLFAFTIVSILIFTLGPNLIAQEVRKPMTITSEESNAFHLKYGMGLTTRYLWRGLDQAKSPALQPYAQALFYGFEISLYGVFGLFENAAKHPDFVRPQNPEDFSPIYLDKIAYNKIVTNLFYHIKTNFGTFRLGVTEYYFSDALVKKITYNVDSLGNVIDTTLSYPKSTWLNWKDNGEGSHTIEASLRFDGNKSFPIWLFIATNIYNDPDPSVFVEAGYSLNVLRNKFMVSVGSAIGASSWYEFNFQDESFRGDVSTNINLTFSREIYLSDWLTADFALTDVIGFYEERNTILFTTTIRIE